VGSRRRRLYRALKAFARIAHLPHDDGLSLLGAGTAVPPDSLCVGAEEEEVWAEGLAAAGVGADLFVRTHWDSFGGGGLTNGCWRMAQRCWWVWWQC